ncbi:hypothetical protein LCGC14_1330490 [marine sediment metagenome]|uniref:Uncharacterized protein n=1 Tax=marine sediment metagenome TaxID=412755 RepID=A0A0F9KHG1_9ZZZZ
MDYRLEQDLATVPGEDTITITREDYLRLRVADEENSRFSEWDISENWSDYDPALNSTDHDDEALNIADWEAQLRKELFPE